MMVYIVVGHSPSTASWIEAAFSSEKRAVAYLTQELGASLLQPDRPANHAYKRGELVYRIVERRVNAYHVDD
jgi:hypothetical protein